jgi:demethylmenaquinone methyltransferase/2-methoxy-6-polyprenyl-1,4-benzoquinol methylase
MALAADAGFSQSCEPAVGRLLATLAASVPNGGRILELGTGCGVGTAWLVEGLRSRGGVELITIELDHARLQLAQSAHWPSSVTFVQGDALEVIPTAGSFELIFADAAAGKWHGLDMTIAALAPAGVLIVDDMAPESWVDAEHERNTRRVRAMLLDDPSLVVAELEWSSGVVLAAKAA